jgi:CheY-like chemotaxis protein
MGQRGTILLAEDNSDDVFLFQTACQEAGIQNPLAVVQNGEEVIRYLSGAGKYADRSGYPLPFLLLLDLNLPEKDGFAVLTWIREHPEISRVLTVAILSGIELTEMIDRAYALGAQSYLVKPVSLDQLINIARRLKEYWIDTNCRPGF